MLFLAIPVSLKFIVVPQYLGYLFFLGGVKNIKNGTKQIVSAGNDSHQAADSNESQVSHIWKLLASNALSAKFIVLQTSQVPRYDCVEVNCPFLMESSQYMCDYRSSIYFEV